MIKTAYELGVLQALRDAGLVKRSFDAGALKELAGYPVLPRSAAIGAGGGALAGGVTGALSDEDHRLRNALLGLLGGGALGGAAGAGAGLYGANKASVGVDNLLHGIFESGRTARVGETPPFLRNTAKVREPVQI